VCVCVGVCWCVCEGGGINPETQLGITKRT